MERLSKKQIKEALDKMKDSKSTSGPVEQTVGKLPEKKANKNRIRKQGV